MISLLEYEQFCDILSFLESKYIRLYSVDERLNLRVENQKAVAKVLVYYNAQLYNFSIWKRWDIVTQPLSSLTWSWDVCFLPAELLQ